MVWIVSWNNRKKNILVLNVVVLFPFTIENVVSVKRGNDMSVNCEKKIASYEELSKELHSLDKNNRMYRMNDEYFCIRLAEGYDITVYNNGRDEVYVAYMAKGQQLTHYHPDYREAYADLKEVLENPDKELCEIKKNQEESRKNISGCILGYVIFIGVLAILASIFS